MTSDDYTSSSQKNTLRNVLNFPSPSLDMRRCKGLADMYGGYEEITQEDVERFDNMLGSYLMGLRDGILIYDKSLKVPLRVYFLAIRQFLDYIDYTYIASQEELAMAAVCSKRTIQKHENTLVEKGIIRVIYQGQDGRKLALGDYGQ